MVAVSGISLASATTYWRTEMTREREAELLFRGDQIRRGIESYYKASPRGGKSAYPRQMKDLLRDSRYQVVRKHMRRDYRDPITEDGDWGLILGKGGSIKGVYSKSKKLPIKSGNFPEPYKDFEKAKTYADWKFIFEPKAPKKKKKKKT